MYKTPWFFKCILSDVRISISQKSDFNLFIQNPLVSEKTNGFATWWVYVKSGVFKVCGSDKFLVKFAKLNLKEPITSFLDIQLWSAWLELPMMVALVCASPSSKEEQVSSNGHRNRLGRAKSLCRECKLLYGVYCAVLH